MITLAIFTSVNSFSTFIATIESFFDKCENARLIDEIIHVDDRSSIKNRDFYISLLNKFLPNVKLTKIYLDEKSYTNDSDYLHNYAIVCENFRKKVIESKNKYVFMLEDDWFFCKNFDLKYFYDILQQTQNPQLILTTIVDDLLKQYSFFNFTKSGYNNFYINNSSRLYWVSERTSEKNYHWNEALGYQYFSQNPNLTRTDFFRKNGPFIKTNHFEFEYNERAKLNKFSYNLISGEPYAYHIGSYKKFLK
jgi:hypothetical protein